MKRNSRIILTIIYVAYTLFIFSNSLQNAAESGERSLAIFEWIKGWLGSGIITEHIIRKAAHFSEFALLGLLGAGLLKMYEKPIVYALFTGLMTAVCDETLQLFSLGRSAQVTDVWIDFAGCVIGAVCMLIVLKTAKGRRNE